MSRRRNNQHRNRYPRVAFAGSFHTQPAVIDEIRCTEAFGVGATLEDGEDGSLYRPQGTVRRRKSSP
ncbi:hypothetical protein [Natronococcus sp.]|uniref:hypothetical protein n=1 Tax=Natronococcus sp. TaxID=35747 RepID=UPI0025CF48CE|nr:hypothetical protein [Natronococcus sp.]